MKPDCRPLPGIEEIFEKLASAKFMEKLCFYTGLGY